jgi:hypothetical protein
MKMPFRRHTQSDEIEGWELIAAAMREMRTPPRPRSFEITAEQAEASRSRQKGWRAPIFGSRRLTGPVVAVFIVAISLSVVGDEMRLLNTDHRGLITNSIPAENVATAGPQADLGGFNGPQIEPDTKGACATLDMSTRSPSPTPSMSAGVASVTLATLPPCLDTGAPH